MQQSFQFEIGYFLDSSLQRTPPEVICHVFFGHTRLLMHSSRHRLLAHPRNSVHDQDVFVYNTAEFLKVGEAVTLAESWSRL